jgi:hypothetical protein
MKRLLPVNTPQREAAVAQACRVAIGPDDSISNPQRTLAQAERRLRYVMERHVITRAGLKVVPHGLRHQDAADAYRAMTGQPPPVAGGGAANRLIRFDQALIRRLAVMSPTWRIEHDRGEPIVLRP